jgi:twitching motility protein PilI
MAAESMTDARAQRPAEILSAMQQVLRAAQPPLPAEKPVAPRWRGLAFQAGEVRLVTDLAAVSDVVEGVSPTRLPGVRPWLRGVANVRGAVYTIADLAALWGMAPVENPADAFLLVLADRKLQSALLVARVFGLRQFDPRARRRTGAARVLPAAPARGRRGLLAARHPRNGEARGVSPGGGVMTASGGRREDRVGRKVDVRAQAIHTWPGQRLRPEGDHNHEWQRRR